MVESKLNTTRLKQMNSEALASTYTLNSSSSIFERDVEDTPVLQSDAVTVPYSGDTSLSRNRSLSSNNANALQLVSRKNSSYVAVQATKRPSINTAASSSLLFPTSISKKSRTHSMEMPSLSRQGTQDSQGMGDITSPSTHHHHQMNRHLENHIAPAIDATCHVFQNMPAEDAHNMLNEISIVHSRRSSLIGLNMALGVLSPPSFYSSGSINTDTRASSNHNFKSSTTMIPDTLSPVSINEEDMDENCVTLPFYSYADMLTDEMNSSYPNSTRSSRPRFSSSSSTSALKRASQGQLFESSSPNLLRNTSGSCLFLQSPKKPVNRSSRASSSVSTLKSPASQFLSPPSSTSSALMRHPPQNLRTQYVQGNSGGLIPVGFNSKFQFAMSESDSSSDEDDDNIPMRSSDSYKDQDNSNAHKKDLKSTVRSLRSLSISSPPRGYYLVPSLVENNIGVDLKQEDKRSKHGISSPSSPVMKNYLSAQSLSNIDTKRVSKPLEELSSQDGMLCKQRLSDLLRSNLHDTTTS